MAKNLEINVDIKFDKSKATSLEALINNINKNNKFSINIDTSKAEISLSSMLEKLKKIQQITNNLGGNFNTKNSDQLNKEKEILEQVATAKKKASEISNNTSIKQTDIQSYDKLQQKLTEIINSKKQLSSVTMNTDNLQNLTSAVIKYKNELGQAISEQWKLITDKKTNVSSFVNTSTKVSDNTSQKNTYNEINNLLKQQYKIETQLITAQGEKKQVLQQNLAIVKQNLSAKSNNKEEILTQQQLNSLINTELQLKRSLQVAQSANNDKINQELSNTKQLIELSQKQLTNQLNTIQSKNNSNINSSFLSQFQNSLKGNDIANRIEQIRQKINSLNGVNTKDVRSQVANLKSEIVELDQKVQMNGIQTGQRQFTSFGQTISNVASKFGIFLTAATAINKLIQEVKQGIEYVKYLDESFTDMAMTMEQLTKTQFNEMGDQLDEMAKKMGVTIEAVHDIGRIYSNEKTSVEEILAKTKPTAELSNIAGMNALTASKNMQDIANQFKLLENEGSEASEVFAHVGDVMTAVSKNMTYDFASGIQELSSAISTSGSVAEMSGDSMERYTATIGSLIEQTGRSGSELANAYKMIAARVK